MDSGPCFNTSTVPGPQAPTASLVFACCRERTHCVTLCCTSMGAFIWTWMCDASGCWMASGTQTSQHPRPSYRCEHGPMSLMYCLTCVHIRIHMRPLLVFSFSCLPLKQTTHAGVSNDVLLARPKDPFLARLLTQLDFWQMRTCPSFIQCVGGCWSVHMHACQQVTTNRHSKLLSKRIQKLLSRCHWLPPQPEASLTLMAL